MTTAPATSDFALVAVDLVHPHPRNVRRSIDGVDELAESIKAGGLHQPLVVAPNPLDTTSYILVMGHRRHAAVQSLGWSEVPCVIRYDLDTDAKVLEAMLAENVARSDLTVTEEGDAVQALLDLDVKPARIAKTIGRTTRHVRDRAQIAALTEKARQAVDDGQITITDALHLSKLDDDHELSSKVDGTIGTPNFRYTLEKALQEAEFNRKRAAALDELEAAGATITDGPATASADEIRIFLTSRPDDVNDPEVSVYVSEYEPWNPTMRVQWVRIRPRDEEDPDSGTNFYGDPDNNTDDQDADTAEAEHAAQEALRKEQNRADREAREARATAQATRHRWLHEKWREGMHAEPGVRAQQLRDLVSVRSNGYTMSADVTRLSPIVAGPDADLDADDPALDPAGWSLDKAIFAAWWIHVGWEHDRDAASHHFAWDDDTVAYLESIVVGYDYLLSDVEEALIAKYQTFRAKQDLDDAAHEDD